VIAPTLTPTVTYDDAGEAVRWLTRALGFEPAAVYDTPDGSVVFAQLVWRTGVVFVAARPTGDNPWAATGPSSIALAAEDAETVDRHYQRAVDAGAEILRPVHDARTPAFPEGSHQFDLRDPWGKISGRSARFNLASRRSELF
jgi:uncharacterized glyoxalase superfamily protein PhnB